MSRPELLTPSLLRMDGRRPYEFRSLEIHFAPESSSSTNIPSTSATTTTSSSSSSSSTALPPTPSTQQADGSIRLLQGLNDVTCTVFGPRDSQLSSGGGRNGSNASGFPGLGPEGASLDVQVLAENWSSVGAERRLAGRGDRRNVELAQLVQRTLLPIISLHLYPRTSILHLSLQITSSDGSILATLLNASSLALQSAGIATVDYCLATCIAFHPRSTPSSVTATATTTSSSSSLSSSADSAAAAAATGTFLIDPTLSETQDLPNMTLAITPKDGRVVLSLLDAGRGKVESEKIQQGIQVGVQVLEGVFRREVQGATREWGRKLLLAGSGGRLD